MQDAKRRALLFLIVALLLSAIAGFLFLQKMSTVDASLGDRVTVYVAKKNISSREQLKKDYFEAVSVPEQFVQESAVTDLNEINIENVNLPLEALVSVVPLSEGDLLTKNVLKLQTELTSKDKRMVTVSKSERIGFDGSFDYNDRVDIIVSDKGDGKGPKTYVFMEDVPIVGVAKEEGNVVGLGLEMTLEEAEKFIHQQNFAISIRILKAPSVKDSESKTLSKQQKVEVIKPDEAKKGSQKLGSSSPTSSKELEGHTEDHE